jgi:2-oxo-4-hydroxy-4-carboxy--5-ureidoimidazoline (OHCU) decarboxylase
VTAAAFVLICLAVGVMVLVHWRTQKRLEDRIVARQKALEDADEARQHALYKQHKDLTKRIASAERATAKMIDETRTAAEDSRLMNQRADALLREVKHGR